MSSYNWLHNILQSLLQSPMKELEKSYGIYFEDYGFDSTVLFQLTLYLFQHILDNLNPIDTALYGNACFGIAFKYIADSFNGNILLFIKRVSLHVNISELVKAEQEILKILDYKIPLDFTDIALTPELNLVLNDVIKPFLHIREWEKINGLQDQVT